MVTRSTLLVLSAETNCFRYALFNAAVDLMRVSGDVAEAKAALDELEKARTTISKRRP